MKKQSYLILVTCILSLIVFLVIAYNLISSPRINMINGEADFTGYNIREKNIINGQWELYEGKLIATDNVKLDDLTPKFVSVPHRDIITKSNHGYMSYRAILKNVPTNQEIMVVLSGISGGYALYINRVLVYTNNRLQKDEELIDFDLTYHPYYNLNSDVEIIIETSNYEFNYTGLYKAPIITTNIKFQRQTFENLAIKVFLIGSLFFAVIYQLFVTGFRNFDKSSLYFSLVCLCGALSLLTYRSSYFFSMETLLDINEHVLIYSHFITLYLSTLFILLMMYSFINKRKLNQSSLYILPLPIINAILPLFLNGTTFTSLLMFFNGLNLLILLIIFFYSLKYIKDNLLNIYLSLILFLIIIANIYDSCVEFNVFPYSEKLSYFVFLITIIIFSAVSSFKREMEISNVQEVIELNNKIRDTEFTFLNTQIQSHFIYNTLNSIQALCYTNPKKAGELIEDFSSYLRTRLEFNKMPLLIDFEDELENIRTYLNIEKVRFENRVDYSYDLKVGDFKIPPLTIQPLVENAIKHGISKKKGGGKIEISTFEDEDYIYVSVIDNGLGFDPKSLNEKQRVGTENIKLRLALHLNADLTINSKPGEGTKATIRIPQNWQEIHNKKQVKSNNDKER